MMVRVEVKRSVNNEVNFDVMRQKSELEINKKTLARSVIADTKCEY